MTQATRITKLFLIALSTYMLADSFLWVGINTLILPLILKNILPPSDLALFTGIIAFGAVMTGTLTNIGAGVTSDRSTFRMGRRRPFIIFGAVLAAVSLLVMRSATELTLLLVGYVLLQIAENIATGPYYGLLPDLVPTQETGLASGIMTLFQFVGSLLGFLVISTLTAGGSIDTSTLILACVMILAMLVSAFGIKERPFHPTAGQTSIGLLGSMRKVPRDLYMLVGSRFFALLGQNVLTFFAIYYVSTVLGSTSPSILVGALGGATLLLAVITGVPTGSLSDKIGRKKLAIVGYVFGFASMIDLAFLPTVVGLLIAGALLGVSSGMFYTTTWALSSDLAPAGMGGTSMSLSNFSIGAAQAVSPGVGGVILYLTQQIPGSSSGYKPLFLISSLYFLVGILLILRVHEKVGRPKLPQAQAEAS